MCNLFFLAAIYFTVLTVYSQNWVIQSNYRLRLGFGVGSGLVSIVITQLLQVL